jgi:hypothetical protein
MNSKPDEREPLQSELKAGDQIVATDIAFFDHAPTMQSQHVGDLMMVNNPRMYGIVGGVALNNRPGEWGRVGLGCSLKTGTFRRATPDDSGYLATREQWFAIKDSEIAKLKARLWATRVDLWAAVAIATVLAIGLLTKGGAHP